MKENKGLPIPAAVAVALVGLIFSPVLLPFSILGLGWDRRRMRAVARQTMCLACGSLLTEDALKRAETLWAAHLAQLQRDQPHVRFRLKRPYDAVCLVCGQEHKWQSEDKILEPVQVSEFAKVG